jgi:hypothetical protein
LEIDQHCVDTLKNTSRKIGERKILCFFLVDPNHRTVSTAHIGEQQWDRIFMEMRSSSMARLLPHDGTLSCLSFFQLGVLTITGDH